MPEEAIQSTTTPSADSGDLTARIQNAVFGSSEPETEPEAPSTEEATATPEQVEDTTTTETTEVETAEADDETKSEEPEPATTEEAEYELSREDVAHILGTKPDYLQITDDGELKIRTKVGDEVDHVSLEELVKGYQLEKHVSQKSQTLYQEKQKFEEAKKEELGKLHSTMTEATGLIQAMEQQLMGDFKAADLEMLRVTNPAEWAAKRQEFSDRQNMIMGIKQQMTGTIQQQQEKQQAEAKERQKELAAKEADKLLSVVPRWSDEAVANEEIPKMQKFLVDNYGYKSEEIGVIPDHRFVLMALDAMKGRAVVSSKANEKITKIRKLPKIVKAGKAGARDQLLRQDKDKAKRIKLKKSGNVNDAAALIFDRI